MVEIDAIVFDVLGTLVDEPAGIRAGIRELAPNADVETLATAWEAHVAREQQRVVDGARAFVPSHVIDREAAQLMGIGHVDWLSTAGRRLSPWHDSVDGLARLSARFPVMGLSNASRTALLELNAHAGLRWHQAISAEDARSYKPDPAVYQLAVDIAGCAPDRLLMVAAHAWDLRGAQKLGLRTAYVARPVGDPPAADDTFDLYVTDLAQLNERASPGRR